MEVWQKKKKIWRRKKSYLETKRCKTSELHR